MTIRANPVLHKIPLFWIALLGPITISFTLGISIFALSPELFYSVTYQSINMLLVKLKVPIGIASLSIPFVAMVASLHRSSQTAHQIELQASQNNFANHFKHLEELKKSLQEKEFHKSIWFTDEAIHKDIYPNTITGDLEPRPYIFNHKEALKEFADGFDYPWLDSGKRIEKLSANVKNHFDIKLEVLSPEQVYHSFLAINKAYSFSGLNPEPIDIREIEKELDKLLIAISAFKYADTIKANVSIAKQYLEQSTSVEDTVNKFHSMLEIPPDFFVLSVYYLYSLLDDDLYMSDLSLIPEHLHIKNLLADDCILTQYSQSST